MEDSLSPLGRGKTVVGGKTNQVHGRATQPTFHPELPRGGYVIFPPINQIRGRWAWHIWQAWMMNGFTPETRFLA